MKRYKKRKIKLANTLMVIMVLIIICLSIMILVNGKKLKGNIVYDNIYHYRVGNNINYVSVKIRDNNIYYFTEKNEKYTLYKRNIYRNKVEKVGDIKGNNSNCIFYSNYFLCLNENSDYYDYDLNLLYSKKYNLEDRSQVIYYQGKILILRDKELYDNDKLIRKIDIKDNDTEYYNDLVIDNNTYIVFRSNSNKTYIYYDILNDKFVKHDEELWAKHDRGFYLARDSKVTTYDILEDKIKKYDVTFNDNTYVNDLKDNIFYFANDNISYIADLEKGLIYKINYEFDKEINQIESDGKYIYLLMYDKDCDIYVIDIDKVSKTIYTFDEYKKYMDNLVDKSVLDLEKKYHVDIVYKDDVNIKNSTFETSKMNNNYVVLNALNQIEKTLDKFNVEFYDRFYEDKHKGLIIYLSGKLTPNDKADTTSNPAGYTLQENNESEIVIDIDQSSLDVTLCHELMHAIEFKMNNTFIKWTDYNPLGYMYRGSYRDYIDSKYTITEEDINNVYFVDEYAKTNGMEDRARVFENICGVDINSTMLKYPHLKEKANYLKEKVLEEFPSLKEATVFNSLNK